jgi:hypothetical protein
MKNTQRFLFTIFFLMLTATYSLAIPTQVTVRAKAHDAKFIGTAMGGVSVSITAVHSGTILAQGLILGCTGSTDTLMKNPVARGQMISNDKSAALVATVDIDEPTLVEVKVFGPQAGGATAVESSKTMWILPGHHVLGDGIVFDLYGFVVVPLTPYANTKVKTGATIELSTYVTMLCGCPISTGGTWDAKGYQVSAWIWLGDKLVKKVPMQLGSTDGVFSAPFTPESAGNYRIGFCVADPKRNNYGAAYTGIAVK